MQHNYVMKIIVPVKRVVDYNVRIRVKADYSGVETDGVKMSVNPFDEIALEEAIRLREKGGREKGIAHEVIAVAIGTDVVIETLRTALAMGADKAVHLRLDNIAHQAIKPLGEAKLIAHIVQKMQAELVIAGKQAIDDDCNQTGQMIASLLEWGCATFASKVDINGENVQVVREVNGGLMTVESKLPCVITTDLRLNQPRYASLPNIMKARAKPIETIEVANIGIDISSKLTTHKVIAPIIRKGGIKVANVDELVHALKNIAKVI